MDGSQKQSTSSTKKEESTALVTKEVRSFGVQTVERSSELASQAIAVAAQAEVEAAYKMAIMNPRHEENARTRILAACRNPAFAKKARYRKPVGKKEDPPGSGRWVFDYAEGPSIRFAEEMLRSWRNVLTQQVSLYDDPIKRVIRITTRDLEANMAYSKEITLDKTVERRNAKDREILGQRMNTNNQIIYIIRATEDELILKEAALASKVIRTNGLRLIPQHIVDEAMTECLKIIHDKAAKDPEGERRSILDGFNQRGISPIEIERFMGMPSAQFSPDDLVKLRDMLNSIEDGHATWAEYIEGTSVQVSDQIAEKSQPGTKGTALSTKLDTVKAERGIEASDESPSSQPAMKPAVKKPSVKPATSSSPQDPSQSTPSAQEEPGPEQRSQEESGASSQTEPTSSQPSEQAGTDLTPEELAIEIAWLEKRLKKSAVGTRKFNAVLGLMKVRLQKDQSPLDVLLPEKYHELATHLRRANASLQQENS